MIYTALSCLGSSVTPPATVPTLIDDQEAPPYPLPRRATGVSDSWMSPLKKKRFVLRFPSACLFWELYQLLETQVR